MKKLLFVTFGVVAIFLASHTESLACSCVPPIAGESLASAVSRARDSSDAIFSGTVSKITERPEEEERTITFQVEKSWNGTISRGINVVTGAHDGNCGYRFVQNEKYLVYTYRWSDGLLHTGICNRTAALADAAEDLKILGEGKAVEKSPQSYIPPELTVVVLRQTRPKRLDEEVSQTDLTVRLKFTNKGEQPLLINKNGIGVSRLWIGKSEKHLENDEFEAQTVLNLIPMQKAAAVKLRDFAVLFPGKSVKMDVAFTVLVLNDPNVRVGGAIAKGQHFFQIQVATWFLDSKETQPIQERFKSVGTIVTKSVTSSATKFVVD